MSLPFTLMPAYGRDYKTADAVKRAWEANKDFKIHGGPYINKSDAERYGVPQDFVRIKYRQMQDVIEIPVEKKDESIKSSTDTGSTSSGVGSDPSANPSNG